MLQQPEGTLLPPLAAAAHICPSSPTPPPLQVPDARLVPGFDRLAPNISLLMAEGTAQISDPLHAAFYNMPFSELFSKVGPGRRWWSRRRAPTCHATTVCCRIPAAPAQPPDA